MIACIRGIVLEKNISGVILEISGTGIGVEIQTSLHTLQGIKDSDATIKLHTHFVVREDAFLLFGFLAKEERDFFIRLVSITGVGPKLALSLLSSFTLDELAGALQSSDIKKLSATPGVGKKTAERLIIEMRDKIPVTLRAKIAGPSNEKIQRQEQDPTQDLISALVNLGWQPAAAEKAVAHALNETPGQDFSSILKNALKYLYR